MLHILLALPQLTSKPLGKEGNITFYFINQQRVKLTNIRRQDTVTPSVAVWLTKECSYHFAVFPYMFEEIFQTTEELARKIKQRRSESQMKI